MPVNNRRSVTPTVAALAGRRIDAQDSPNIRFPLSEAEHVSQKLIRHFRHENITHLICSAACGADILALEAAEKLAISTTIVLPFAPQIFREISVTDRPGNWGKRFDRLVVAARDQNDLIVLGMETNDRRAYSETNRQIIHLAVTSRFQRKIAYVVWDGKPRGSDDSTAEFLGMAISKGFTKRSVLTKRRGK